MSDDKLHEARDPLAPADRQESEPREVNPSETLPNTEDWEWYLKDGVVPYRVSPDGTVEHMFAQDDDGWAVGAAPLDDLWDSTPEIIASIIGGRERLTEPVSVSGRTASVEREFPFAEKAPLAEADSTGDFPDQGDSLTRPDGMSERQIRAAGLRIDLPFEAPLPRDITYKDTGQQTWTPPPGWKDAIKKAAKRASGGTGET